jgi:cytosine/adenosine deaminase-related metal-dependent hydrolase
MSILLDNAIFIDWETLKFTPTSLLVTSGIEGGIRFLSKEEVSQMEKPFERIDCSGKYVTKSFAVGHHHVYSALARGMGAPKKNPENFVEILEYIWWNLDKCLDLEMIEYSALTTAMACAKAGSTFVIDHHASPNAIKGSLEIIAKAFDQVGVSHLLCYEITDRDGDEKTQKGLLETEKYLQKHQGLVGLHASFTVSDTTLKKAVELSEKYHSGIHIHVAEDKADQEHSEKNYGKRVVERLHDFGVLESSKTILGHGLHLSENERRLIAASKAWMVQNMESNLNNKVGLFHAQGLGDRIMLGTDGMHSDMLQSAKAAFFVGQQSDTIDYTTAYQRFRNVHHYLNSNNFAGDGENNLVVLDYDTPTAFHQDNFLGHFLFGLNSNHIKHVISNGEIIVKDRKIQKVDETEILNISRLLSEKLWAKMKS